MNKVRVNISLDSETEKKIKEIAEINHTTVSQWITDRVWDYEKDQQFLRLAKYQKLFMQKESEHNYETE